MSFLEVLKMSRLYNVKLFTMVGITRFDNIIAVSPDCAVAIAIAQLDTELDILLVVADVGGHMVYSCRPGNKEG